jgi:hypothetical protein
MRLEAHQVTVNMPDGTERTVEVKVPVREKDKVYIVGCAGTKDSVPYDDKDAEFWGVNNLYGVPLPGAQFTRWFEIHNIWFSQRQNKLVRRELEDFRGQKIEDYLKGLASLNIPVYMQTHWVDIVPLSVQYPLQDVLNFFMLPNERKPWTMDETQARYLTNTISLEIALAIYEGFKEIQVWGVDMQAGTEYEHQKPSCEFWAGVALGMGIKFSIPDEAHLLKTKFIYGFEEPLQNKWTKMMKKTQADLEHKMMHTQQQVEQLRMTLEQYRGAIHMGQEVNRMWTNLNDNPPVISS